MDPKSLAKSKRSFTQSHSKKSHHSNKKQASSTGKGSSGNSKKVLETQSKQNINLSRDYSPSEPSDQGPFDDSLRLNPEGDSSTTANVVIHKSSGADYRLLISDAEAMPLVDACLDPFAALDDFLPDFRQGLRSMLSVRGEGVSSLLNDDIFILDDETTTDPEPSFLPSIDLPTLVRSLRNVPLSKRLFVDADVPLPYTDMLAETSGREDADPVGARKSCESGEDERKGHPQMSELDQFYVTTQLSSIKETDTPVLHTDSWRAVVGRATLSATRDDENKNTKKMMLESEAEDAVAELDMLLNSTFLLGSPPPSDQSTVTNGNNEYVPGEVMSGFDAWLDTI